MKRESFSIITQRKLPEAPMSNKISPKTWEKQNCDLSQEVYLPFIDEDHLQTDESLG